MLGIYGQADDKDCWQYIILNYFGHAYCLLFDNPECHTQRLNVLLIITVGTPDMCHIGSAGRLIPSAFLPLFILISL